MKLDEMPIQKKILLLESLVAKAKLDLEYAIQVTFGDDKDAGIVEMETIIFNARELFVNGRIDSLDLDVREGAIKEWHELLDCELSKFPEFYKTLEQNDEPKL